MKDLLYATGIVFWALALYAIALLAFGALLSLGSRLIGT